jgi:hypothetical protein
VNKGPVVIGITLTSFAAAFITVSIRLYSRAYLTKFRGQDDLWIIGALVSTVVGEYYSNIDSDDVLTRLAIFDWRRGAKDTM